MTSQQTSTEPEPNSALRLVAALGTPFIAAAIGAIATSRSVSSWYQTLRKPRWTPPSWLFGPAWSMLYLMMGVASWLIWHTGKVEGREEEAGAALRLYSVHLAFNTLWSVIFFGWQRIGLGLAEILVLWSMILATLRRFQRINRRAGLLLVPYQLWVTFATALNAAIWWLNRTYEDREIEIELPASEGRASEGVSE